VAHLSTRLLNAFIGLDGLVKALVLLSGGIDSATALYLTSQECSEVYSLNIVYEEAYDSEAGASKRLAAAAQVKEHLSVYLPLFKDIEKRYRPPSSHTVSPAYLPARNMVFYSVAAAYAETLGVSRIVFGSNADDAKELPDATLSFIRLMNALIKAGTRAGSEGTLIEVVNPLLNHSKAEVLKLAIKLKVPLQLTWSCYENAKTPCGKCRGCLMRATAFSAIGAIDPLLHG
jgi:7-cyano-7-deazaguanine synthase